MADWLTAEIVGFVCVCMCHTCTIVYVVFACFASEQVAGGEVAWYTCHAGSGASHPRCVTLCFGVAVLLCGQQMLP